MSGNPKPETVEDLRSELIANWMLVPMPVANHLTAPTVNPAKVVDAIVTAARDEGYAACAAERDEKVAVLVAAAEAAFAVCVRPDIRTQNALANLGAALVALEADRV